MWLKVSLIRGDYAGYDEEEALCVFDLGTMSLP